jgi:hypothetical protein
MKTPSYFVTLFVTLLVGSLTVIGIQLVQAGGHFLWFNYSSLDLKAKLVENQHGEIAKAVGDNVTPILPSVFPAVPGQRFSIYFDGLITARDPDNYIVEIHSPTLMGISDRRKWSLEITSANVGRHSLTVTVKSLADGAVLAKAASVVIVADPPKPHGKFNVLIVGASNIQQALVPNILWTNLNRWNSGGISFVGSEPLKANFPFYRPSLPQVKHEGLGGWGWQTFASHYMPGKEALYKLPKSPFVFLEGGKPRLNVGRYLDNKGLRGRLDAVIFDLGINETFGANPNDPASMNAVIAESLSWADKLVADFHAAAPEAKIIIGIPAPFTRSEPVFVKRYASSNPDFGDPWRHRQVVLALARSMIEYFSKYPYVTLAPTYAVVDVVDGYWQIDPGHPNEIGSDQIAACFEAALLLSIDTRFRE